MKRAWSVWVAGALGLIALGGAGGWAATIVLTPPPDLPSEAAFTSTVVREGEVSSSLRLNTAAEWTTAAYASNLATGTVTSILVSQGQTVSNGTPLYSVNLRPIVLAQGSVPSFAALQRGDDNAVVGQLQQMLADLGLYGGEVDGEFGLNTERAVRSWQRSVGVEATGIVEASDLVFVPSLPARVKLDSETLQVGKVLSGGEASVEILAPVPEFSVILTADQAASVPDGALVSVQSPSGNEWQAVSGQRSDVDGAVNLDLEPIGVEPICGGACEDLPVGARSLLDSQIFVVEPTSGSVVPTAAIVSNADGETELVDLEGTRLSVVVIAAARGVSVIEGVPLGTVVRVPATAG